jgi:hypothetical protein
LAMGRFASAGCRHGPLRGRPNQDSPLFGGQRAARKRSSFHSPFVVRSRGRWRPWPRPREMRNEDRLRAVDQSENRRAARPMTHRGREKATCDRNGSSGNGLANCHRNMLSNKSSGFSHSQKTQEITRMASLWRS